MQGEIFHPMKIKNRYSVKVAASCVKCVQCLSGNHYFESFDRCMLKDFHEAST